MAEISKKELEKVKDVLQVYENPGTGTFDAFHLGPVLRSLGLNPSNDFVEKLGAAKALGEKQISLDEFLPIYGDAKNDKDQGVYEDFIECLKLYDKLENGYMPAAELQHYLLNLGERLTNDECDEVCTDCMDEEDDDGNIPYVPFLARMCGKPVPKNVKPE